MTTSPTTRHASSHRRRSSRQGLAEPAVPVVGQPSQETLHWELPALLLVLVLATVLYFWGMGEAAIHPYYSAAVRSMSASWRSFVFGGLDAGGSITVDKIPGALWPQALSVRVFGPHVWAVAFPQAVEGVLSVLVLHRIVRAWAGPVAALLAALILALSPISVALGRHSIPDTLLTLLLVLAAGALQKAVLTGRLVPLLTCGALVGLAFQAKMLQAWLVLPVFGAVYLLAAPGAPLRRAGRVLLAGGTAFVVSCAWVLLVYLTPGGQRPYLDGTRNNNPFTLVFGYNGLSRFGGAPDALGSVAGTTASRASGNTGLTMLLNSTIGPQISWFLPLSLLAFVLGVLWRKGQPRTDPLRAGFVLWGGWLLLHTVVFSSSNGNHGYYTAVLAPALAALSGAGLALFRSQWQADGPRRVALPAAIALTVVWAVVLQVPHHSFAPWLLPLVLVLGLGAAAGLWIRRAREMPQVARWAFTAGVAATLLAPAVWTASTLDSRYAGSAMSPLAGPVGNAYQEQVRHPAHRSAPITLNDPSVRDAKLLKYLTARLSGEKYLLATQAAYTAEPLLRASTQPMLVMGGFTGLTPYPTAPQLESLVAAHQVRYALLTAQRPATPATAWIKDHCTRVRPSAYGHTSDKSSPLYDCYTPRRTPATKAR
ncbi:glycosyltransferase family 39 protein [Streptomyces sp. So13.3]|uniref:ArnT family glycosyltransferase n=1 Tax=Streptomyces TaxID=1883 RepID=UPI0011060D59|nr:MULTISPECIES: glycosyltransferase family 39 protein [Streptomyces]MCZ4103640.1 glycosyltransferase family 39 protein [Streptomyces sp. H39-C1]QNA70592.1 glycosyltransferase family 39 protein [Streptomyces sp. So13.3]